MRKIYLLFCLLLVFLTFLCNLNLYASQEQQNNFNYNMEARGLVLKYVLIDTSFEIYEIINPKFSKYFNKQAYKEKGEDTYNHYLWLKNTYEKFTPQMKRYLAVIYDEVNPWRLINQAIPLNDNAKLEGITEQLQLRIFKNSEARIAIKEFYPYFYVNFLKEYLEKNAPVFDEKANSINIKFVKTNFNLLDFMEKISGIKFKEKYKPVFYYTLRPLGGYGFVYKNYNISTIVRTDDSNNFLPVPFHEFTHVLFETFTSSVEFQNIAKKMKEDAKLTSAWRDNIKAYDWRNWCEENLVEGFADYLGYKYNGTKKEKPLYVYDVDFCNYLINTNFDPSKTTLKDAGINFYESILEKKNIS